MNNEIPYLINSLYSTCYEKNKESFDKDELELHYCFKDNSDLSLSIKKDKIINKIISTLNNKELIKNMTDLYVISLQSKTKLLKLKING